MNPNVPEDSTVEKEACAFIPSWFLVMTSSPPLMVAFAIAVLLCSPLLMIFGALYPLFKR